MKRVAVLKKEHLVSADFMETLLRNRLYRSPISEAASIADSELHNFIAGKDK